MLDARLLLQAATGLSHEQVVMRGGDPLVAPDARRFDAYLAARLAGRPVSRILGRREFWGLSFGLNADTLDPRPDTETIVSAVLARLAGTARPFIRDLGTGSGAILVALLHALPGARGLGTDISYGAVAAARRNARAAGVARRAAFALSDWGRVPARRADVIVSNPPYIARPALLGLMREVRGHDPARALDGGPDGLAPYRRIAGEMHRLAMPRALLAVEIGSTQGDDVQRIFARAGAHVRGAGLGIVNDLAGRPRVMVARAPHR